MSEWSVPAGMTPQDNPGQPKDGIGALVKRIHDNATEMRDKFNNLLKQAGIKAVVGGLRILGFLQSDDFDGDLDAGDAGTTGWAMNASRVAIGELFLRPGSLGNDTLANPITYREIGDGDVGMAVSATPTQSSVRTMTVPDGYTASGLVVLGSAAIVNTTASTQYVSLQAYAVDTDSVVQWGGAAQITLAAGFSGSILAPLIRTLDGLTPGMNLTFYVNLWASAAMTAHASNWTGIEVQAAFTR